MKKIITSILIVISIVSLCSCTKNDLKDTTNSKIAISTENEMSVEPFDFGEYKYYFTIKTKNQEFKLPCTIGELIDAGFKDVNFSDDLILNSGEITTATFLSNDDDRLNVTLSNPTNHDLSYKDIFVIGCDIKLSNEDIKIYPSKTNATQKFLYSKLGIEDAEIVLGEDSKWLGVGTRNEQGNPINISYKYGDEDIFANILLGYKDENLHNVTIMFENLF